MAEKEEKKETYSQETQELLDKVEEILSKKRLCLMYKEPQGLSGVGLTGILNTHLLVRVKEEEADKEELQRIINDAVASGDGADFGIIEK